MPYDPLAPLEVQIRESVSSSLKNLRHSSTTEEDAYIDSLLLHTPLPTIEQTLLAWKLLESYVPERIRSLSISNVTLPVLQKLYEHATVKPSVVQNRFYPQTSYDEPLRAFCRASNIKYQSFWTLTGNPDLLASSLVSDVATATHVSTSVALYALVMDLGIEVLNGTSSAKHMREDLDGICRVRDWAVANAKEWAAYSTEFQGFVGLRAV